MPDFGPLARNLLTLEINTVEKDGMSGQKMPSGPQALVETAETYWDFLCREVNRFGTQGEPLEPWLRVISMSFDWGAEPFPPPTDDSSQATEARAELATRSGKPLEQRDGKRVWKDGFLRDAPDTVTAAVLDDLRQIAFWSVEMRSRILNLADTRSDLFSHLQGRVHQLLPDASWGGTIRGIARGFRPQDRAIFHRIRRNCDQLKAIFDGGPAEITRHSPDEVVRSAELVPLRKAWDIGTEVILMQTVIQIDGDVVSRFQSGLEGGERAQLQTLHASAVDISFKYWGWLVDALSKIAGQAVSSLLRST
ncbi:hypothetical protein Q4F19_17240 [Sphingomonas sp. BIUV-7]|uniref:AbiTii domain-containing protein n=1 Tax=Sphingomonas natans TaxID=3063330 RepID=A0ABT8YCT2_9SPHN|nr:hypothetical protein [Sphingomonas sp. BIUV-7]MDO6416134.1 hypothetical protein [Sphingomonas sp. BIUV-7]